MIPAIGGSDLNASQCLMTTLIRHSLSEEVNGNFRGATAVQL